MVFTKVFLKLGHLFSDHMHNYFHVGLDSLQVAEVIKGQHDFHKLGEGPERLLFLHDVQ